MQATPRSQDGITGESAPRPQQPEPTEGATEKEREYFGRALAEWVTLSLSIAVVTGLAAYLVYHALRRDTPYVPVEARPLMDEVAVAGGRHILPVEVHNASGRTLKDVTVEVSYGTTDGSSRKRELKLDFLAARSSETRYLYFDDDPRGLRVEARALGYALR
jgi:uncharacterized protein (TIGR02588 family)